MVVFIPAGWQGIPAFPSHFLDNSGRLPRDAYAIKSSHLPLFRRFSMNRSKPSVLVSLCLFDFAVGLIIPGSSASAQAGPEAPQSTQPSPIDWEKAKQLYQRSQAGEKLTPEEQAYLDQAKQERTRQQGGTTPENKPVSQPAGGATIDWEKAKQLYQRSQAGEKLTPEEQAYLDRAKQEHARQQGGTTPENKPAGGATPPGLPPVQPQSSATNNSPGYPPPPMSKLAILPSSSSMVILTKRCRWPRQKSSTPL